MRARQKAALDHAVAYEHRGHPPHKNRIERLPSAITVLTVVEISPGYWVWQASMSFQHKGGALHIGAWTQAQADKADATLRRMLESVGARFVFGIRPMQVELREWKKMVGTIRPKNAPRGVTQEEWEIVPDADAYAYLHRELPFDMGQPSRSAAMHLWRTLSEDELAYLYTKMGNERAAQMGTSTEGPTQ